MTRLNRTLSTVALLLGGSLAAQAQSVTLFGSLSNFDVLNDTGQVTHGFEIELDGVDASQAPYYFTGSRYGGPTTTPFAGGIYVRYKSPWDPAAQQFTIGTEIPASFTPTFGHACVFSNIIGCDHYGVVVYAQPTNVVYRWLVADPQNPGALIPFSGPAVQVPQPVITIQPPPPNQPAAPPVVVFEIRVPPPPPAPKPELQYSDAKWVKVYKTEVQREVALEELVGGNPVVPEDPGSVETAWKLLQFNPHSANSGVLHSQAPLQTGSHAVVRRYEFYKFAGTYDAATHQAICGGDGLCTAPLDAELGDYIGDQMAAVNVGVPSVTVTKIGTGTVNGASGKINCGGSCTTNVSAGASVSLTANPGGGLFSGWGGACNGTQLTCNLTVNDALNVTATFTPVFTLSLGHSNAGTVTADTPGVFSTQINCGSSCSAKFGQGTTLNLTATPAAGKSFVNWTGACSGSVPTCSLTISSNTQVQANFK
jgi:hypothetical protein